jgi:hypothetical protein
VPLTRRTLLQAAAAATAAAILRPAHAIGPASRFRFGHLQVGGNSVPHKTALHRLLWEIQKRTSIEVDPSLESPVITPTSPDLHETPIEALRRFLTFGGFLIIDSAEGSTDGAFDQSVRQLVEAIFPSPQPELDVVSPDHVVYKSFYLLDRPLGRLAISPMMEAVTREDRMVVAYVQNDLGGAWARDDFGNYELPCEPDGERQRELAFRMGVNLVMYALCLDYKSDQVHVPFIMRRRRWKPDDGAVPTK